MSSTRIGSNLPRHQGAPRPGGDGQRQVQIRDLDGESQRAHELLKALGDAGDTAGRAKILSRAGGREPLTPRTLAAVADLYARLDMPLSPAGILRFKADRGLVGGGMNTTVAKAFSRALDGGEVLFRIDRKEELALRPADKGALDFLRRFARVFGAEAVGRLKEALNLSNPPVSADAAQLANEYVGLATLREVTRVTTTKGIALHPDALKAMVEGIEAEKQAAGVSSSTAPKTELRMPPRPVGLLLKTPR